MRLERIALSNFRNYAQLELEPQPGLNVFIGANAQGKSNLLEAIAMLGVGKSFRIGRDADTIRDGEERAAIGGEVARDEERLRLACSIVRTQTGTKKSFSRNGRNVPYAKFLGTLSVVTFVPSDLQLVTGAPALRRAFLNTALSQHEREYYRSLARYQVALRQKNALLRAASEPDETLVETYESELVSSGAGLMIARRAFVAALDREASALHAQWSGGAERLELRYEPNVAFDEQSDEEIRGAIARRLRETRAMERARRMTVVGPHRDDVAFVLDQRPLAAFGSQGQQRTAVLAVKAAEYAVMRDRSGLAPLLLLDDLLSELDEHRAAAFLNGVCAYEQAYVTATHRPVGLPARGAVFFVEAAAVRRAAAC